MPQESKIPSHPLSRELLPSLPQEVQSYILFLENQVVALAALVVVQEQKLAIQEQKPLTFERRIQELEAQLAKKMSDLHMLKVKQKILGCHRAFLGGEISCRIRSYLSTSRKQGWSIWVALTEAITGSPRLLSIPSS